LSNYRSIFPRIARKAIDNMQNEISGYYVKTKTYNIKSKNPVTMCKDDILHLLILIMMPNF